MNWIPLRVRDYKVRIYCDSVKQRHYYQLKSGKLESSISELAFYQSLREMNWKLFKVKDI